MNTHFRLMSTDYCFFTCFFTDYALCEYLVDGGLARSEAALIRSNQCLGVELQSFTQYARKDLICDREKAHNPIVGPYRGVSLFQDRTQSTKVPIAGHVFVQPYFADKLVHTPYELFASGLKQLSREAVGSCCLVVFKSLTLASLAHLSPDYFFCPCRMTLRAWNLPSDAWCFWKISEHRSYSCTSLFWLFIKPKMDSSLKIIVC